MPTKLQAVTVATSGGGSSTVAIPLGTTTGAGLLVAFGFGRATQSSITDTGGRTWTPFASIVNLNNPLGSSTFYSVWTAPTGAGGDSPTVTIHGASSNWIQGSVVEVGSCDTSTTPISVFATKVQGTTGTAVTIGPTGTSGASELAISFFGEDGGGANWTAPSGWATAVQQSPLNVGVSWLSVASQTVTAAWTSGTIDVQGGVIVVIKAASGGLTLGLTGQTASFTGGALAPSAASALTGQSATFTGGTITVSGNLTLALTGLTSSFTQGVLALSSAKALTAQSASFTQGTLSPSGSLSITGQTATFAPGALSPSASMGVAGQTATFTQGTITASTGSNLTLALTGLSSSFSEGSLGLSVSAAVAGLSSTFSEGAISATPAFGLSGQSATFTPGTFGETASFGLLGQNASFTQGQITAAGGNLTLSLSGLTAAFSQGLMSASGGDVPMSGDTHDGGTQVVRESHYRKVMKLKPKKGQVQRADLVAEPVMARTASIALHTNDDDEVLNAYFAAEDAEIEAIAEQLTQIAGHLVTQLTRK